MAEPIAHDNYPSEEVLESPPEDSLVAEYIRKGRHSKDSVLPELDIFLERLYKLEISPFDVLQHWSWDATPKSLTEFLYSAKNREGPGKQTTKMTVIEKNIKKLVYLEKVKDRYFDLVFRESTGYGSGMPSYHWAAALAILVDYIISKLPELKQLCKESSLQREHIELGIHQYFLDRCVEDAKRWAKVIGKALLYTPSICEVDIEQLH